MMRFSKIILAVFIIYSLGILTAFAQTVRSDQQIHPTVKLSKNVIPAGDSADVAILLNIEDGWHVNAHFPTYTYLVGTNLTIDPLSGFSHTRFQYPESKSFKFAFARNPLAVYQGKAPIFFALKPSPDVSPGTYTLDGHLKVQACNDKTCLPPSEIDLSIQVEVVAAYTGFKSQNTELFSTYPVNDKLKDSKIYRRPDNQVASMFNNEGAIWAFIGIFFMGLALNLTPCVYPMLSVTVSLFGGQADKQIRTRRRVKMASVYVLGMISMYSALGVAAAYTGQLFGGWLQSPYVLAAVGVILLVMALSMFGLYELQPPQWVLQKLVAPNGVMGMGGHFLSGMMVGIFAAPCIGPPVIALLAYVGAQGDPTFGFLVFATMAFGLGLPYLLLGSFSGWLNRLPGAGEWMVWVKKFFGTVLIGAALFFLALAVKPSYVLYTLPPSLIGGGIYLGFLDQSGNKSKNFTRFKWGIGIAGLIGGIIIIMNLSKPTVAWEHYRDEKLIQKVDKKTPVLLDFYADWCIPCLELDRITFTDAKVIKALEPYRTIKVDLTNYDTPQAEAIRKKFNVAGVPTLIFLDKDGNEIRESRIVGFVDPAEFLKQMPDMK